MRDAEMGCKSVGLEMATRMSSCAQPSVLSDSPE